MTLIVIGEAYTMILYTRAGRGVPSRRLRPGKDVVVSGCPFRTATRGVPAWACDMCRPLTYFQAAILLSVVGPIGCVGPPRLPVRAERYHIEVRMDPASHGLTGLTTIDLVRTDDRSLPDSGPVAVELLLHPDLKITRVTTDGTELRHHAVRGQVRKKDDDDEDFVPRTHRIILDEPADALTLSVEYQGSLFQDVSAGEKPGVIHNFAMRTHIGEEGIYLADGAWYPEPAEEEDAEPALAEYTLVADPVPGLELVAGAERDPDVSERTGRLAWHSPYALDGMVLVGGPHEIHQTVHNGVTISLHLKPSQARHVDGLFDAVKRYLDRYEPLVGPYPASEYSVVDNFFSSGFAFPTFTLLASAVIDMGKRPQMMHGFIDHEMLHSWWGNGIHVDPQDGNWCEALTSYATNYYGYVLDGKLDDARRKRRNYSHFLSRIKPEDDKPLGTFSREDGCGRGIGYSKGTLVMHMLARKIGQDNYWAAMRRFTEEYLGRYASWDDIRRLCEEESPHGPGSLETFFTQWVRGSGAPTLTIERAHYDPDDQTLTLALSQGEPPFDLDFPVRIAHADGTHDIDIPLDTTSKEVTIPVDFVPQTVEVDPDYHIFRKVPRADIIPTTNTTRSGDAFASILSAGGGNAALRLPESYGSLKSIFESSFEDDERIALTVGEIDDEALADRCVLIVGEAVRDPQIAEFLREIAFPVSWTDEGFEFDGVTYTDPADALLCTVVRPGAEGRGVTVVFANSEDAFPRPNVIPMYDRSLVIYKNHRAVLRRDFERRNVVDVEF